LTCADVGAVVHSKGPRAHRVLQPEQRHGLSASLRIRQHRTHRNTLHTPNLHFRSQPGARPCSEHPVRGDQGACTYDTPASVQDVDHLNLRRLWQSRGAGSRVVPPREDQRRTLAALGWRGDLNSSTDAQMHLPGRSHAFRVSAQETTRRRHASASEARGVQGCRVGVAWLHGVEAAQTAMTAAAISAAHDDGGIATIFRARIDFNCHLIRSNLEGNSKGLTTQECRADLGKQASSHGVWNKFPKFRFLCGKNVHL
jgi:hypothetical protein